MSERKMRRKQLEMQAVIEVEEAVARKRRSAGAEPPAGPSPGDGDGDGRGLLPFAVQAVPDAGDQTGRAGLTIVAEALRGFRVDDAVRRWVRTKQRQRGFSEYDVVESIVMLLAAGGEHMEDMDLLREDAGLCRMMGRGFPSADVVRDFLVASHDEALLERAAKAAEAADEKSYIPEENEVLAGLGRVNTDFVRAAATPERGTCATIDYDATVINSHKREAKFHYKGDRGYQPPVAVWVEQDLVVVDQFRDGNVPAGKDNLPVIQRAFAALPSWVTERKFRGDSACYEELVLKWLAATDRAGGPAGCIEFTVSADMTKELRAECKKVLEADGPGAADRPRWAMLDDTRADETVEWAEVEFTPGDWPKTTKPLRYIALRFHGLQGRLYDDDQPVKYLAVVTNSTDRGDQVVCWHWGKAGTIEHVHDETKNGLGAGTLPCGEFGANAAWFRLNILTYNVLSLLRHRGLPPEFANAKAKRLRFLVFNALATLTTHARRLLARLGETLVRRTRLRRIRHWLREVRRATLPAPAG
jgi:hypothetical protein